MKNCSTSKRYMRHLLSTTVSRKSEMKSAVLFGRYGKPFKALANWSDT